MSTRQEQETISHLLLGMERPVIFDLGAYCGEDSEWMRAACEDRHEINVMVEPDPRNVAIILGSRRGVKTRIIEAAIGAKSGLVDFHFAKDARSEGGRSGSGSIRNPAPHQRLFPEIKFTEMAQSICWTLDDLLAATKLTHIDLLWCDIQGAERDMIAGGQKALDVTKYLFTEAEETELYEGQALRKELLDLLPNFKVIGEFGYNLLLEHR